MELDDFKAAVKENAAFLTAIQKIIPRHVDQGLVDYLRKLDTDPVGLELLRNTFQGALGK